MHRAEAIARGLLHMLTMACVGVGEEAEWQRRPLLAAYRCMFRSLAATGGWHDRIINRAPMPAFGGTVTCTSETEIHNPQRVHEPHPASMLTPERVVIERWAGVVADGAQLV